MSVAGSWMKTTTLVLFTVVDSFWHSVFIKKAQKLDKGYYSADDSIYFGWKWVSGL